MCDMDIGHQQVVATDSGNTTTTRGTAINGDALANGVAITNLQTGRFTVVFEVLWRLAYRGKLVDLVTRTNRGWPVNDHMRADPAVLADLDIRTDH